MNKDLSILWRKFGIESNGQNLQIRNDTYEITYHYTQGLIEGSMMIFDENQVD